MFRRHSKHRDGFTLAEIAVVLTVFALLVGGVLVGNALIRTAHLQSVISDVNRFKQAAKLFRDKYKYLPGDFARATEFWGEAIECPEPDEFSMEIEICDGGGSTSDGDGDGDGDGRISAGVDGSPGCCNPYNVYGNSTQKLEPVLVWQHLSKAGLIEGAYSGAESPATQGLDPGRNIPESAIEKAGFTLHFALPVGTSPGAFRSDYGHVLMFGRVGPHIPVGVGGPPSYLTIDQPAFLPALSGAEARDLDIKIDDGRPGTGHVLSFKPSLIVGQNFENIPCATTSVESTAEYVSTPNPLACSLIFVTGF